MGQVYLGRMFGPRGFSRFVAIKRLHPGFGNDPRFVSMLVNEAGIASAVRHPNVVPTVDVVEADGEVLVVTEYVEGESFSALLRAARVREQWPTIPVVARIIVDLLRGLDAAHEAVGEASRPLEIVHRDVSPQNVIVGIDGAARVVDFGIAKAVDRARDTQQGEVKGKLKYIAPEQLTGNGVDRRADIYAAGIVLWEALTGHPYRGESETAALVRAILEGSARSPAPYVELAPELEAVVLRALHPDPSARFAFARQMADALEAAVRPASSSEVGEWVRELAGERIAQRILAASDTPLEPPSMEVAPTDVSPSVSVIKTEPPAPARGRSFLRWTSLAAIVGAAALAGWGVPRLTKRAAPPTAIVVVSNPVVAAPSSTSTSPAASDSPPIVSTKPESAAGSAVHAQPARSPGTAKSKKYAGPPPPDCRVPYTIDESGIRIPRPECG
jgi:serine/threonine-protein kinase